MAGTLCFFLEDVTGLMSLKRNLVMLGSGLMVPLHFLEPLIGTLGVEIFVSTPLALIGYYPTLAYIGKLGSDGIFGIKYVCWVWPCFGSASCALAISSYGELQRGVYRCRAARGLSGIE